MWWVRSVGDRGEVSLLPRPSRVRAEPSAGPASEDGTDLPDTAPAAPADTLPRARGERSACPGAEPDSAVVSEPRPAPATSPASPEGTRTWPSPSGSVPSRRPALGDSRSTDSPILSSAPGGNRTGRVPTRVPSRVVPFVESRSATETRPSAATVIAQCRRETSGSSRGTSASAERPMWIWPPCSRWTPPASGPATTWSWVGASSSSGWGSGAAGAPRDSTAPSISGGSPRVARWVSSRSPSAYSTTGPPPRSASPAREVPPSAGTAEASAVATAASAVPTGAVTSTSQLAARPRARSGGPSGSTTVSRICIAVSGPFCADEFADKHAPKFVGLDDRHPRTCH